MMSSVKIGRFFRTHIRIHYTWILVLAVISWAVSTQYSTETALLTRIGLGAATSVLFLFAMFLREILLLSLAVSKGVVVQSVTIFAFGGLIQVDQDTTTPSHELLLAVSGMLCNLFITGVFYLLYVFLSQVMTETFLLPLKWLAFLFITLSAFHVIPGFPLEGGRMLHVILWKVTGNFPRATRIASWIGWLVGFATMVGGILLLIFSVELFTGVFLIGIGLILQNASRRSLKQITRSATTVPSGTGEASPLQL
jgi:Zn-dependent protease